MKLFQRVFLHGSYGDKQRTGKVVGKGSILKQKTNSLDCYWQDAFIVELDEGFYSEDKKTWTLHVLVDESNLEVITEENKPVF